MDDVTLWQALTVSGLLIEHRYRRVSLEPLSRAERLKLPRNVAQRKFAWVRLLPGDDAAAPWQLTDQYQRNAPADFPNGGYFLAEQDARVWLAAWLRADGDALRAASDAYLARASALERGEWPSGDLPDPHEHCYD